ncbi:hypothetical protein BC332_00648 [Capsicum chinense]|uniref:Transmembrane protein n=1 Tax=Capsicum annuum TaxID=4072 RepID=A0A1U8GQP7_CAPAN|nr:uncharacterized protein LOC107868293 [Capsicum annuum]KAF3670419.1 putative zeaxanthin epoxidase, chloroplastic-like [Capsicum annuum]PHT92836.1 hypothetical protein T459_00718 [Capsicum annuum]PHU28555.1 hypothetical protein BC332_00648 [Capsicum chinense]
MYRSSSTTRVSEEFFFNSSPSIKSSISSTGSEELPTFNPQSHIAKKERNRLRSAENAIHLIPLVLVLSAIVLWVFSSPVNLVNKADSIVARLNIAVNQPEIHEGSSKRSFTSKLESEDINATDDSIDQENNESDG